MYRILLLLCLIALPAHARSQADILRAQQELGKLGYDLTADGHESPAIAAAIRAYQRDWQLPEDGLLSADIHARLIRADPATAPAMQKAEGRECRVRNDAPGARETVTHDGPCLAGVREGEGRTTWRFM